ncbi:MAG: hypothetical protein KAG94_02770 [Clostridiales bacterium]|nr:hypothetical protein [Clostridiales bacterium]
MKFKKLRVTLLIILFISVGVAILLSPLFSIKQISIRETIDISHNAIFEKIDLTIGDNIFISLITHGNLLTKRFVSVENTLKKEYEIMKNISVKAIFPNKLIIDYDIAQEGIEIVDKDRIIITDEDGFVLGVDTNHKQGRIKVTGLQINSYSLFEFVDTDQEKLKYIAIIYKGLTRYDQEFFTAFREYINWIDVSNDKNIAIMYDERVLVKIPYGDNVSLKIATMCVILSKQIRPEEKGVLDMTVKDRSIFTPD